MTPLPSLLNLDLAHERTRVAARRGAGRRLVRPSLLSGDASFLFRQ